MRTLPSTTAKRSNANSRGLALNQSRKAERVLSELENVRFARQDLSRLSIKAERSVESAGTNLRGKADAESKKLDARRHESVDARAVENAGLRAIRPDDLPEKLARAPPLGWS
jgi:hypothetical protein